MCETVAITAYWGEPGQAGLGVKVLYLLNKTLPGIAKPPGSFLRITQPPPTPPSYFPADQQNNRTNKLGLCWGQPCMVEDNKTKL